MSIFGLKLFYIIFLPLTTYPIFWLLDMTHEVLLMGNTIISGSMNIDIIGSCIAGSAYFFLLFLNLSTGKIPLKKRTYLLLTTFGSFFIINLIRIYILGIMYLENSPFFDIAHKILWYLGGTIFVVLIWFFGTFLFKIKTIPIYTDMKEIYSKTIFYKK